MRILTFVFLLCTSTLLFAQKQKFKFGKISKEELTLSECSFYPEANAMVLAEVGNLNFHYHNDKGWQYQIKILRRIKIFNKLDKDIANVSLTVYDPVTASNREEITSIKGFTYNLENGKIIKSKLQNSDEYKTRLSDYRVQTSFAMPDVREGSIIEYEYTQTSDYIVNLFEWKFQDEIPVAYSEYNYTIPEYFYYTESQLGSYSLIHREESKIPETFTYTYGMVPTAGRGSNQGKGSLTSISRRVMTIGTEILPILEEPHLNNKPDLPSRLEFQLQTVKMPNSQLQQIAGDYKKFNKNILDQSTFGGTLNKGNFAKDKLATLEGEPLDKAVQIFNWLSGHFTHNDVIGISSDKAGRQAFNEGKGSVADINLTLIAVLRKAGVSAYPVILSTRGSGTPHPVYPSYEDFNYVVVAVENEGTLYLCDASSSMPFGFLPSPCLNGQGWLAQEPQGRWIDLKRNALHKSLVFANVMFDEEQMNTSLQVRLNGYAGLVAAGEYKKNEEDYIESISSNFPEMETSDYEFDLNEIGKGEFKMNFNCAQTFSGENIIYLQPLAYGLVNENPFKREKRMTPIDFNYSYEKQNILRIQVPEGYTAELPESVIVSLPEDQGKYIYSAKMLGGFINININYSLNKNMFLPNEYPHLKQFFQMVADKNNEVIVLKKRT